MQRGEGFVLRGGCASVSHGGDGCPSLSQEKKVPEEGSLHQTEDRTSKNYTLSS